MYVVKRPFKSLGKFYEAGSVITDPASIKFFKTKVKEGKILRLDKNADNYNEQVEWLEMKTGKSLKEIHNTKPVEKPVEKPVTKPVAKPVAPKAK